MAGTNGLTRANELLAITDSLRLSSQVGSLVQEHEETTVFSTTPNHRVECSIELNTPKYVHGNNIIYLYAYNSHSHSMISETATDEETL